MTSIHFCLFTCFSQSLPTASSISSHHQLSIPSVQEQHDRTPNEDHGQWPTGLADWGSTSSSLTSWSLKVVGKAICVGTARSYCSLPYHFKVQMKYNMLAKMGLTNYTGYSRSAPCLLKISKSMVKQGLIRSHTNPQGSPGFSAISQVPVLFFGDVRPRNYCLAFCSVSFSPLS